MPRYCYLHVGTGKTGSSAIQTAFARAHNELLTQGYLYPDLSQNFERMKTGIPTAGNALAVERALRTKKPQKAINLIARCADSSKHLVLSCEAFWKTKYPTAAQDGFVAGLQSLGYETKCFVVFRPQVEMVVSSYLQQVKAGKPIALRRYARRFWDSEKLKGDLNWHERAKHLERAFGDITVAWYPAARRSRPDGVIASAFEWLGATRSPQQVSNTSNQPTINPSPGLESLMLLQIANANRLGGRTFADEFLKRAEQAGLRGTKIELHPVDFATIYQATYESNKKLIERYCPQLNADEELGLLNAGNRKPSVDKATLDKLGEIACTVIVEQNGGKQNHNELMTLFTREISTANPSRLLMNAGPSRRRGRGKQAFRFTSSLDAIKRFVRLVSGHAANTRIPSS